LSPPPDIARELERLEEHLYDGAHASAARVAGRLLERLRGRPGAESPVLRPLAEPGTPGADRLEASVAALWRLLEQEGLATSSDRNAFRKAARRRTPVATPGRRAGLLDRAMQRRALHSGIESPPRSMALVLHGGPDQGHGHLARFCLDTLRQRLPGAWEDLGSVSWPPPMAMWDAERRGLELVATVCRRLDDALGLGLDPDRASAGDLCSAIAARLRAGKRQLFLRHTVAQPVPEDAALLGRYLQAVWRPLADGLVEPSAVLTFEFVLPDQRGCLGGLCAGHARRARRAVRDAASTLACLVAPGVFESATLPELSSLCIDDIVDGLPRELRDEMTADEARSYARRIWAGAGNGRFEHVLRVLTTG